MRICSGISDVTRPSTLAWSIAGNCSLNSHARCTRAECEHLYGLRALAGGHGDRLADPADGGAVARPDPGHFCRRSAAVRLHGCVGCAAQLAVQWRQYFDSEQSLRLCRGRLGHFIARPDGRGDAHSDRWSSDGALSAVGRQPAHIRGFEFNPGRRGRSHRGAGGWSLIRVRLRRHRGSRQRLIEEELPGHADQR